jgi:hypothetical protein
MINRNRPLGAACFLGRYFDFAPQVKNSKTAVMDPASRPQLQLLAA